MIKIRSILILTKWLMTNGSLWSLRVCESVGYLASGGFSPWLNTEHNTSPGAILDRRQPGLKTAWIKDCQAEPGWMEHGSLPPSLGIQPFRTLFQPLSMSAPGHEHHTTPHQTTACQFHIEINTQPSQNTGKHTASTRCGWSEYGPSNPPACPAPLAWLPTGLANKLNTKRAPIQFSTMLANNATTLKIKYSTHQMKKQLYLYYFSCNSWTWTWTWTWTSNWEPIADSICYKSQLKVCNPHTHTYLLIHHWLNINFISSPIKIT